MMKSRENAKKTGFSKIGLAHILDIAICISVQNFMKKYKVQLKKFKKYRFSGENSQFRRFLESSGLGSGYKNKFNRQMNHS